MSLKRRPDGDRTSRKPFHVDSAWSEGTRLVLHGVFPDDDSPPVEVEVTFASAALADEALEAAEEVQGAFEGFDEDPDEDE